MYISKIQLEDFGKFKDYEITLNEGINCIYGKNEDGKSTIKAFVSYLFSSIHQPYSYDKIKKEFDRYKPLYSNEFKGHLVCSIESDTDSRQEIRLFQDFKEMKMPEIVDREGMRCQLPSKKLDMIGFQEIEGEQSKNLLKLLLEELESLKGSLVEGLNIKEILHQMENAENYIRNKYGEEQLLVELHEINQWMEESKEKYHIYKEVVGRHMQLRSQIDVLKQEISSIELQAKQISREELVAIYVNVQKLNNQIQQYQEEIDQFERHGNDDLKTAEEDMTAQKELETLLEEIAEKKEKYINIGQQAQQISVGREYNAIYELAKDENIEAVRETIQKLNEQYEAIEQIKQTMDDISELKVSASNSGEKESEHKITAIAKDYYKYNNMKEWRDTTADKVKHLESEGPDLALQTKLLNRRKFLQMAMIFSAGGIIIGSVLFVYLSNYFLILLPILFFCLMGSFGYLNVKNDNNLERFEYDLSKREEELAKYQRMLDENESNLFRILKDHQCKNEKEFFELFTSTRDIHSSYEAIGSKLNEMQKQLEIAEVGIHMTQKRIMEIEDLYAVEIVHLIEKPGQLKAKIEEYIDESRHFVELSQMRNKVQQEIASLESKANSISRQSVINVDEVEMNNQEYQLAKYELERLKRLKEENLKSLDEQQLQVFVNSYEKDTEIDPLQMSADGKEYLDLINEKKTLLARKEQEMSSVKEELGKLEYYLVKTKSFSRRKQEIIKLVDAYGQEKKKLEFVKELILNANKKVSLRVKDTIELKVGEIIFKITNKYTNIRLTNTFDLEFYEKELKQWIPVRQLSAGAVDQIYISLRLAIAELAKGDETFPIIFDDSFVQYDKKRLLRIIKHLASLKRQVIILTCHKREQEIMETLNIAYHSIQLS